MRHDSCRARDVGDRVDAMGGNGQETKLPRRLLAILHADVQGYGTASESDEEGTYRRLKAAEGLFRALAADYGGRIVNVAGDGILATFETPLEAAGFALEIQRELRNADVWNKGELAIRYRIGINLGDVIVEGDNVHGHHVNLAERVQRVAPPGGICITEAVRQALPEAMRAASRSLGRPGLKNTVGAVDVHELLLERPAVAAPPATERPARAAPLPGTSIVVLPLANLNGDPADQHLCDGLTGELIASLTRFRDLLVIARHSAFAYRTVRVDEAEFARMVGARYVLSGALQRSGARLRLNARLSEAVSARVIWSEHYDGVIDDVFAFQDDVTSVIPARLAVRISTAERQRLQPQAPPELEAYGFILRGQELALRFQREPTLHARRLFEEAEALDPGHARPLAGLSRTYNLAWRYRWDSEPERCLNRALELAQEAVQRDPLDARGHAEVGFAQLYLKQHDAAVASYGRALELNPNDADILAEMGQAVCCAGDARHAIGYLERAMRLNPLTPDHYLWFLGECFFDLEDYDRAIATMNRMLDPGEAHRLLAAAYALSGQPDRARDQAAHVLRLHPDFTIEAWRSVPPDRNAEALGRFFEGLRQAGLRAARLFDREVPGLGRIDTLLEPYTVGSGCDRRRDLDPAHRRDQGLLDDGADDSDPGRWTLVRRHGGVEFLELGCHPVSEKVARERDRREGSSKQARRAQGV